MSFASRPALPLLLSALAFGLLAAPSAAQAYCRLTTVEQTEAEAARMECPDKGVPLFWRDLNFRYGFNAEFESPDLSVQEAHEIIADSFERWRELECADGSPGFEFTERTDPLAERLPGHILGRENVNVLLFQRGEDWARDSDHDPSAFALTSVWYAMNGDHPGEILGADMEINGGRGPYVRCPDTGCPLGVTDLANVITHEAGHVLGLAHSPEFDSTMYFTADALDVNKRDLHPDDVKGFCAIYNPDGGDKGCSAGSSAPSASGLLAFGLAALALVRRRLTPQPAASVRRAARSRRT